MRRVLKLSLASAIVAATMMPLAAQAQSPQQSGTTGGFARARTQYAGPTHRALEPPRRGRTLPLCENPL
jgi:hypothetical protein